MEDEGREKKACWVEKELCMKTRGRAEIQDLVYNKRLEIYDVRLDIYDRYFNFKNERVSASGKVDRGYPMRRLTYMLEQMSSILQVMRYK